MSDDLPCIGECGKSGPPDPMALWDIYECPECQDARADAAACGPRRDDE